jgi:hypothetical protein
MELHPGTVRILQEIKSSLGKRESRVRDSSQQHVTLLFAAAVSYINIEKKGEPFYSKAASIYEKVLELL